MKNRTYKYKGTFLEAFGNPDDGWVVYDSTPVPLKVYVYYCDETANGPIYEVRKHRSRKILGEVSSIREAISLLTTLGY